MHSLHDFLPEQIVRFLRTKVSAEFATVSAGGVPIDTPTFIFPNDGLTTLDIGTGLAYPAKAERARRNPKVGLLLEGGPGDPVVSVAGHAAVRDRDIQANLERYLAETIHAPNIDPAIVPWSLTRQRLYYVCRIIVEISPVHVRWWPNRAAMDGPPAEWRAPSNTVFPASDAAPSGAPTPAPAWAQRGWSELAARAVASGMPAHLTLLDAGGFPIPIRASSCEADGQGFRISVPQGAPWASGKATLSFVGREIFVGEAEQRGTLTSFRVERALPVLPMMEDRENLGDDARAALDRRLFDEMERRGGGMPIAPDTPPEPTIGAQLRAAAAKAIDAKSIGAGLSNK